MPTKPGQKPQDLPLPQIGVSANERLLVRYDRPMAGSLAWIRVTIAGIPSSIPLNECLSAHLPAPSWQREADVENVELNGRTASRISFLGRWKDQDFINETVAVRQGEDVYFISAAFPASDGATRAEVRKAVAHATWQ